jgi:hypothetical protein
MKKNRNQYYFTAILLTHILVYFFKFDRDIFAFKEYYNRPNQTYTEQPYSKSISNFCNTIFKLSQPHTFHNTKDIYPENIPIWKSIYYSYNSRVHQLLKLNEFRFVTTPSIIVFLHRKNITHKSSEDDDLKL